MTPTGASFYWWTQSGPEVDDLRCWLIAVVVVLWAFRLTGNWVYGFPGLHHEDWRYPMFEKKARQWEFVVDLVVIGIAAVATELVADAQMHRFVKYRRPGEVMDRGLWGWSRHPNYFGEVSFWFALALFGVAASPSDAWWLFLGALAMLAMFVGGSIPMMEKRSLERRPDYQDVIDRVPRFVPRPPKARR